MRTILRLSAIATVTLWLFSFFVILSSALTSCEHPQNVDTISPVTGWKGVALSPVADNIPSNFMLMASLTEPPRNLSVNVYYFPVGTPAVDAINSINNPGTDEDSEPLDPPNPDEIFEITNGASVTNYNVAGKFSLYLLENQLAVLEVTDDTRTTFAALETIGNAKDVMLDLTKARSARKAGN